MTQERWVYATFDLAVARLNVVTSGTGRGSVSGGGVSCASGSTIGCRADVPLGATATLTATATPGSVFAGWGGACSGAAPTCAVAMTRGQWVYATFQPYTFRLTVVLSGPGAGAVNGASGTSSIACATGSPAGCAADVAGGATITLRAAPAAGSVFAGWAGACAGTGPVCDLEMSRAAYAYATFARGG